MTEIHKKRLIALRLFEEFKSWHWESGQFNSEPNIHNQVIIYALMKDILTGTEDDVDRLIGNLEKQNSQLLMNKLAS